jgi:hypothetical protein
MAVVGNGSKTQDKPEGVQERQEPPIPQEPVDDIVSHNLHSYLTQLFKVKGVSVTVWFSFYMQVLFSKATEGNGFKLYTLMRV